MKFLEWFDRKLIYIDSVDELKELKMHYIITDINILKKVYNAYKHTGILDLEEIKIGRIDGDKKDIYYFLANDKYLNLDSVFQFIRDMKGFDISSKLDKEVIKKCFTFVMTLDGSSKDFDPNKEYYFLLSLNPDMFTLEYIKEVDLLLNKEIQSSNPTKLDDVIDTFIHIIESNPIFKYTIATNWEAFAIIGFEDEEKLSSYIEYREEHCNDNYNISMSKEDLEYLLNHTSHFTDYEPQVHYNNKDKNNDEPLLN